MSNTRIRELGIEEIKELLDTLAGEVETSSNPLIDIMNMVEKLNKEDGTEEDYKQEDSKSNINNSNIDILRTVIRISKEVTKELEDLFGDSKNLGEIRELEERIEGIDKGLKQIHQSDAEVILMLQSKRNLYNRKLEEIKKKPSYVDKVDLSGILGNFEGMLSYLKQTKEGK